MARYAALLLLLLSVSAQDTCGPDGVCMEEGAIPAEGSALLTKKRFNTHLQAAQEGDVHEDGLDPSKDVEAADTDPQLTGKGPVLLEDIEAASGGPHLTEDGEEDGEEDAAAPAEVGDQVVSFAQSSEGKTADDATQATKIDVFESHWISMIDKGYYGSKAPKHIMGSVDGRTSTWGGAVVWQVDLGDFYFIEALQIAWRACKCMEEDSLHFDASVDGETWRTFLRPSGIHAWGDPVEGTYRTNVRARHVRIYTTKVSEVPFVAMWEVQFSGRMDPKRNNVYGWHHSYVAGNSMGLGGTEITQLQGHQGALFAAVGYRKSTGPRRAGEIVRLDCAFCDWFIDGTPSLYAERIESLKSVTWTTDRDGAKLAAPVQKLYAGYYYEWEGAGRCDVAGRYDPARSWPTTTFWQSRPWDAKRFAANAMALHHDKVTGADVLLIFAGMPGVVGGHYDFDSDTEVKFAETTETGPLSAKPLGIAIHDGAAYFSASSWIMRRTDGTNASWHTVFDMADFDDQTVDEATGGIRGLSTIGNSMLFSWAPNARAKGCMFRLDKNGDGFSHQQEACAAQLAAYALGVNNQGQPPLVAFVLAAYNDVLTIPASGGFGPKHIIGFELLLYAYTAHQFPVQPSQTDHTASGKRIAYYAGGAYIIRHNATLYEPRELYERKYDPMRIYPSFVAARTYVTSPFANDDAVFFGGYDCNHFPSSNTAWVLRGERSAAFAAPIPCQKEYGCGHVPGKPFHALGCNLCRGREFNGLEVAYFKKNGTPISCQKVLDWLNLKAPADKCAKLQDNKWFARRCCGGCDFCLGTGRVFDSSAVAGKDGTGNDYTCGSAMQYVLAGNSTCHTGTALWKGTCCK